MTRIVGKPQLLSDLAKLIGGELIGTDYRVSSISNDSREIQKGDLFISIDGSTHKGDKFLSQAFQNGAAAAVVSSRESLDGQSGIACNKPNFAASFIAGELLGNPSKDLTVIGVTGTNGKTTTTWIITEILESIGIKTLRIGTLGASLKGEFEQEIGMTTPDPLSVQHFLAQAKSKGAKAVVMEVSSHALHQGRVAGVHFDGFGFTNISQDHLDYHQTMERYVKAKALVAPLLAKSSKKNKSLVVCAGDEWTKKLVNSNDFKSLPLKAFNPDLIEVISSDISGQTFCVNGVNITIPLIGLHNTENSAVAFLLLNSLGLLNSAGPFAEISPVPGRLEPVGKNFFVDYAHTPDALLRVLKTLKPYVKRKLWVVFGCGGDRDKGKRSQMGEIACNFADEVVVTSDNPRTEDPKSIVQDILKGCTGNVTTLVDRAEAIRHSVSNASSEDIVLIAGKGHENYQILGTQKIHFSDREVIEEALSTSCQ